MTAAEGLRAGSFRFPSEGLIRVGARPPLGINRAISDGIITGEALEAADALPPGSAKTVVTELRQAALKLLGLHLQRADRVDQDAETLDRCETVGDLTVGGLREILHSADRVLCDRYWVERPNVDQDLVGDGCAHEHFEFSEGRYNSLNGIGHLIESIHKLVGELQVLRDDPAGIHASPSLVADTRSVGDGPRPGVAHPAPGAGHPGGES